MPRARGYAVLACALALGGAGPAAAAPWCSVVSQVTSCGFASFEQCRATISGVGGRCERNLAEPERRAAPPPMARPKVPPAVARPKVIPPQPPQVRAPSPPPAPVVRPLAGSFAAARALLLSGKYEASIAAMRDLQRDDDPDVAGSIGYASLQLGRLDDARTWLARATKADPNRLGTLRTVGQLNLAEKNPAAARETLARIRTVCGTTQCPAALELDGAIAKASPAQ